MSLFSDIEIHRLARDIEHAIAEGRLRTTESVYDYVYSWVEKKSIKKEEGISNPATLLKDSQ